MRGLVFAMALLWGAAAEAQVAAVLGGEHGTYTRLVLRVPDAVPWTLSPRPGGFELSLPEGVSYDLQRAFDRISQDRIGGLTPLGGGRLGLAVPCDCHAEASQVQGVGLVVDMIDGPPPPGGLAPGAAAPAAPALHLPLFAETPPAPPLFGPLAAALPPAAEPEALSSEADRVTRTEAAILESVADAASRGLLDVAHARELQDFPIHSADGASVPGGESFTPAAPAPGGDQPSSLPPLAAMQGAPAAARPGLAFRTGADSDRSGEAPLGATGTPCLPDEDFDLAAWAGSGEFGAELPARLARLTDERDRLDSEAVEALARTYLAFGLGREAATALALDGRSSRERDVLRLLARLVDGEAVHSDLLEGQGGCLGPVALWRAIARGSLRSAGEGERIAITLALRTLPQAVRGMVALRLAGLFLEAGDARGAEAVAALAGETGIDARLARIGILRELEGPAPALDELEALAEQEGRMTPAAMVSLIDLSVEQGRPVPEGTLELARALRFELGGVPGRALLLAEARALTAGGHFEDALALLAEERAARPGEDLEAALAATVSSLSEGLGDAPFLELALGGLPSDLPDPARDVVARRLLKLGFPDEAAAFRSEEERAGAGRAATEAEAGPTGEVTHRRTEEIQAPGPASSAAGQGKVAEGEEARGFGETPSLPAGPAAPAGDDSPADLEPPPAEAGSGQAAGRGDPAPSVIPTSLVEIGPDAASMASAVAVPETPSGSVPRDSEAVVRPPGSPSASMTLADRRALLERAAGMRARAADLLAQVQAD